MEKLLAQMADSISYWLPALAGGVVDYLNQLQRGSKTWSIAGFLIHLLSAVFFGWVTGTVTGGFDYSPNVVAAAGGMGGFLGVRIADLVTYRFMNIDRRQG
jgi:hypothetical protein